MIRLQRPQAPAELTDDAEAGPGETRRAIFFFSIPENKKKAFAFAAYRCSSVKNALNKMCSGKCAYCESEYINTQPVDVEHFRPKSGVIVNGNLEQPGYYWLAADWDNLLPSCIDCNRSRHHPVSNGPEELLGKANLFPVANEVTRVRSPGPLTGEQPLLLDPCSGEEPDDHLEFDEHGFVWPKLLSTGPSPFGEASIKTYGLHRQGLVNARKEHALRVGVHVEHLMGALERLEKDRDDEFANHIMESSIQAIKRYLEPSSPYAGALRQLVAKWFQVRGLDLSGVFVAW